MADIPVAPVENAPVVAPAPVPEPAPVVAPVAAPEPVDPKTSAAVEAARKEEREIWQKRTNHLTWEREEEKRKNAALAEQLKQKETAPVEDAPPPDNKRTIPIEQVPALVAAEAANQAFNQACNAAHAKGVQEFPDFDEAMKTLAATGFMNDRASLEAATAVPEAHKVLQHLGKNPAEAMRLQAMTPMQRAVEVARISLELGKPVAAKKPSSAPAPINPVGGGGLKGEPDLYDTTNLSTPEWIALRNKQIQAQRTAE